MTNLHFLKDNPEIAKNLKVELTASELLAFVESIKPKPTEVYITPDDLCAKLDVSLQTLINWDDSGILKPIKFGRLKRYRLSDIEKIGTR